MKKRSAIENIRDLPDSCYTIDRITGKIIEIRNGESGYHETFESLVQQGRMLYGTTDNQTLCDILNRDLGVTKAAVECMEIGSMFGYENAGANIENYNKDGSRKI